MGQAMYFILAITAVVFFFSYGLNKMNASSNSATKTQSIYDLLELDGIKMYVKDAIELFEKGAKDFLHNNIKYSIIKKDDVYTLDRSTMRDKTIQVSNERRFFRYGSVHDKLRNEPKNTKLFFIADNDNNLTILSSIDEIKGGVPIYIITKTINPEYNKLTVKDEFDEYIYNIISYTPASNEKKSYSQILDAINAGRKGIVNSNNAEVYSVTESNGNIDYKLSHKLQKGDEVYVKLVTEDNDIVYYVINQNPMLVIRKILVDIS